jgi:hypothetical protein
MEGERGDDGEERAWRKSILTGLAQAAVQPTSDAHDSEDLRLCDGDRGRARPPPSI